MRSVVLGLGISIDGYIARPDGAVDFLFMPRDYSMADFFSRVDTAIMGRRTFDIARQMGAGSSAYGSMKVYVLSRTQPAGEREGVVFTRESPSRLVNRIRKRPGKDIWMMGGGEAALGFLAADLIDEIYLGIVPVLLGEGIPLFRGGFPQRDFRLIENQTYSRGLIALKYRRVRPRTRRKP
jgi:dihydrofolate reductase